MHQQDSAPAGGLLDAVVNLATIAESVFTVRRNGLIFEKSGDSMAVFDGPHRIDRVSLRDDSERVFLHAIDLWLLNRYMAEVA